MIIFIVAFSVRLLMIGAWHGAGRGHQLSSDSYKQYAIAESLAEGKGFRYQGKLTTRRGPVYPYFLALFLVVQGFPIGIQIAQAILGAVSCVLIYRIAGKIFGDRVGILSAALLGFDYYSIKKTVYILPEVIFVFLLLLTFLFLLRVRVTKKYRDAALAGLFAGLTILTKEAMSYFFPVVIVTFFLNKSWKRSTATALIFLLGFFVIVFPWLVRNRLVTHQWVPVTVIGGHAFYMGNHAGVNERIRGGDWIQGVDGQYPINDPNLPPLLSIEADRYLMRKGLEFVRQHPYHFLKLTAIKALRLWFPYYSNAPLWSKGLTTVSYCAIMIFSVIGIFMTRQRWKDFLPIYLLIAYVTMVHSVTIPSIRYRYPLMPFLMMFAAYAISLAWTRWKNREKKAVFSQ